MKRKVDSNTRTSNSIVENGEEDPTENLLRACNEEKNFHHPKNERGKGEKLRGQH